MRLVITTEARNGYEPGDILACLPDGARLGLEEDIGEWVAAGRPPGEFPNPWLAIVDVPGEPVDLNLTEPELGWDPVRPGKTMMVRKRAWRVDLGALRADERAALDAPGGRLAVSGRRFRRVAGHRSGTSIPLRVGGDTGHRRAGTDERARLDRAPRPASRSG